jgi:hexosaminidase
MFEAKHFWIRRAITLTIVVFIVGNLARADVGNRSFAVTGFHLDLRIQVMTVTALKNLASNLRRQGFNTLIVEWERTFPFERHPLITGQYAYTKEEVASFIRHSDSLGLDVIPLQQSFGHVEYILRHQRYKSLREDQHDFSQVCPLQASGDSILFKELFEELVAVHSSPYIHIGGDETYLLGHDDKCSAKAASEGKSKLYTDYVKMVCSIVKKLGKRPILWADIALKYPEMIRTLPKETILVDWNYGWDLNRFGDHKPLLESGLEVWGAPSIRSWPDNYYLTSWDKHFGNISDFVPLSQKLGYKGIVLTSWSTSGLYASVFESEANLVDLYAVRHVYPLSGFNILIAAFAQRIRQVDDSFVVLDFIRKYGMDHFGFDKQQSIRFGNALIAPQYDIKQGVVASPAPMTIRETIDSNSTNRKTLAELTPARNTNEYAHFILMLDIRDFYLRFEKLEAQVNETTFRLNDSDSVNQTVELLIKESKVLDKRFEELNTGFLYRSEINDENMLRNFRLNKLNDRLKRVR